MHDFIIGILLGFVAFGLTSLVIGLGIAAKRFARRQQPKRHAFVVLATSAAKRPGHPLRIIQGHITAVYRIRRIHPHILN